MFYGITAVFAVSQQETVGLCPDMTVKTKMDNQVQLPVGRGGHLSAQPRCSVEAVSNITPKLQRHTEEEVEIRFTCEKINRHV